MRLARASCTRAARMLRKTRSCGTIRYADVSERMLLKLKRTPGLYLVGFMGSGKSAVGRLLADELGWSFADVDEDIEKPQGVSIAEIFDTRGEEEFRRIEQEAMRKRVRDVECGKPHGAGARRRRVRRCRPIGRCSNNAASRCGWIVRSRVSARALEGQTHRPLARDPEKFRQLFDDRRDAVQPSRVPDRSRYRRCGGHRG